MERYLSEIISKDLTKKMVFVAGPRQVGKTTVAKSFLEGNLSGYLNWDVPEGRERILKRDIPLAPLVVFDELHKFKTWKGFLKGLFDDPKRTYQILVTGSARLDLYQRGGDSLQGRYHMLRLHPFSVKELQIAEQQKLLELIERGGFPEPFFSGSLDEARRWAREYRFRIVQEEIRDLERIEDLSKVEQLMLRLPELVGSPLSINALREDLQVAHKTVDRWLLALERLYAIYRIPALSSSRIKALRKSRKCYLYNWSVVDDAGARFENFVAGHLLKWVHYQQDIFGRDIELVFVRDTSGREVDFALVEKRKVLSLIECKLSNTAIDDSLKYFQAKYPEAETVQIVQNLAADEQRVIDGVKVVSALNYLNTLI